LFIDTATGSRSQVSAASVIFNVQSYCKIRNGVNKIVKKSLNKILSFRDLWPPAQKPVL
jgi:hypothetical protein